MNIVIYGQRRDDEDAGVARTGFTLRERVPLQHRVHVIRSGLDRIPVRGTEPQLSQLLFGGRPPGDGIAHVLGRLFQTSPSVRPPVSCRNRSRSSTVYGQPSAAGSRGAPPPKGTKCPRVRPDSSQNS